MLAVLFEFMLPPERRQDYFDIAAILRPELEKIDGFISVERFASLSTEGKYLSLSFWRDEDAIRRWREHSRHHAAQAHGRAEIFGDYRIHVVRTIREYGKTDRAEAPQEAP